jgi:hypothetical protein
VTVRLAFVIGAMALSYLAAADGEASPIGIRSAASLGAADSFGWGQLKPGRTYTSPQSIVSAGGARARISSAGGTFGLSTPSSNWIGVSAPESSNLDTDDWGPDLAFSLNDPVSGIGAHIQSDALGSFTAEVTAFDFNDHVLGSFSYSGLGDGADDGPGIFVGLKDTKANISKVQFRIWGRDFGAHRYKFHVGRVDCVSPVPLPPGLALFATALAGLASLIFVRRRGAARRGARASASIEPIARHQ